MYIHTTSKQKVAAQMVGLVTSTGNEYLNQIRIIIPGEHNTNHCLPMYRCGLKMKRCNRFQFSSQNWTVTPSIIIMGTYNIIYKCEKMSIKIFYFRCIKEAVSIGVATPK